MKFNLIILLSAALASTSAYSQTGGSAGAGAGGTGAGATVNGGANGAAGQGTGASGGVSTTTSSSSGAASSTTSGGVRANPQPVPPTVQKPNPNPNPTLPIQEPFPPPGIKPQPGMPTNVIAKSPAASVNQFPSVTNQPLLNANPSGTNQAGEQSQAGVGNPGLTPTAQAGATNRVFATNAAGLQGNANPSLMRDQAISESDRRLLSQIRLAVLGPNQAAAPLAGAPVHFILRDGSVRLVGTVGSEQEKQRIENLVQQVPGVVRVYDALQVNQSTTQPTVAQPAQR